MNKLLNINSFLNYDYSLLYNFTQIFIDIVRNSGGYNSKRLLLLQWYECRFRSYFFIQV